MTISPASLSDFTRKVFLAMGVPEADAQLATEVLLVADLRGVDSHGVARLTGYVRLWESGRINPKPQIKIVHETPGTATVDGDAGL
ncbi:MAG TPA: malate dehydrogenase, partial [Cytophagales bacterium]|nr:malate dehydrogenase [Cytophagales bacterium]